LRVKNGWGREGACHVCGHRLKTVKCVPESSSGRMTLVFARVSELLHGKLSSTLGLFDGSGSVNILSTEPSKTSGEGQIRTVFRYLFLDGNCCFHMDCSERLIVQTVSTSFCFLSRNLWIIALNLPFCRRLPCFRCS